MNKSTFSRISINCVWILFMLVWLKFFEKRSWTVEWSWNQNLTSSSDWSREKRQYPNAEETCCIIDIEKFLDAEVTSKMELTNWISEMKLLRNSRKKINRTKMDLWNSSRKRKFLDKSINKISLVWWQFLFNNCSIFFSQKHVSY